MKNITRCLAVVFVLMLAACGKPQPVAEPFSYYEINFDELVPDGISPEQCWNGMGMDEQGRVMIGYTSNRSDGHEDFLVFRYTPSSGKREYLAPSLIFSIRPETIRKARVFLKGIPA